MTFEQGVAQCKAQKLGVSACLDLLDPLCGDKNPEAIADPSGVVTFRCGTVPSAAKAAILLKEAEARAAAASGPPWLLIGAGVAAVGLVVYLATR